MNGELATELASRALELLVLLERIDERTADFARASGLACPAGCGACCLSPHVETTAGELVPLALELFRRGAAEELLRQLARAGDAGPCVLYAPDPTDAARGRCTVYAWRPAVCRLFAFSARRDRAGRAELIACGVQRAAAPELVRRAEEAVAAGLATPLLPELAREVALAGLDAELLPIGRALRRALERVGLALALAGGERPTPPRPVPTLPRAA
jgi:Fe-S-cluster containining protein